MLLDDLASYLATQLGLTIGTSLHKGPIPETGADPSVGLVEYPGQDDLRAMGPSLSTPVAERPRLHVTVRHLLNSSSSGRDLIEQVKNKLNALSTTLGTTRYLQVRALNQPVPLGEDAGGKPRWVCSFEIVKERG